MLDKSVKRTAPVLHGGQAKEDGSVRFFRKLRKTDGPPY